MKHNVIHENLTGIINEEFHRQEQRTRLLHAPDAIVSALLNDLAATHEALLATIRPKDRYDPTVQERQHAYDVRWEDLLRCLQLENYAISKDEFGQEEGYFAPIEPQIAGQQLIGDDLTKVIRLSDLPSAAEVIDSLAQAEDAFRSGNLGDCMTKARIALETVGRDIALRLRPEEGDNEPPRWGRARQIMREADFLSDQEDRTVGEVYTFISPGAHTHLGMSEQEFALFGRNLAVSMTYYLVKRYVGRR